MKAPKAKISARIVIQDNQAVCRVQDSVTGRAVVFKAVVNELGYCSFRQSEEFLLDLSKRGVQVQEMGYPA